MGGDEVGADGGQPTDTELRALAARVRAMDDAATGIVASITGAKDVATFRQGFELLTTDDLRSMRQLFRRMGLQVRPCGVMICEALRRSLFPLPFLYGRNDVWALDGLCRRDETQHVLVIRASVCKATRLRRERDRCAASCLCS